MHRDHLPLQFPRPAVIDGTYAEQASTRDMLRDGLLDSWKEIAAFLGREVRTVQLWEKREGLPVHRHFHVSRASVHAYRSELAAWQTSRRRMSSSPGASPVPPVQAGVEQLRAAS